MMLIFYLLLVAFVRAAVAGPFEDGFDAFKHGDYPKAVQLYREAAEQGIAKAQFNLGLMFYHGQSVPQDYSQAHRWFQKAAEQGYAGAQLMLGFMYNKGQGVSLDHTKAVQWFRQAAEQGDATAQLMLGAMYKEGKGVPHDYVQAYLWLKLGATQLRASEAEIHDLVAQALVHIAAKMSPAQVAEAQKLAREWRPK